MPNGLLPAIELDGQLMTDSIPIMLALDRTFDQGPRMVPAQGDPARQRADEQFTQKSAQSEPSHAAAFTLNLAPPTSFRHLIPTSVPPHRHLVATSTSPRDHLIPTSSPPHHSSSPSHHLTTSPSQDRQRAEQLLSLERQLFGASEWFTPPKPAPHTPAPSHPRLQPDAGVLPCIASHRFALGHPLECCGQP